MSGVDPRAPFGSHEGHEGSEAEPRVIVRDRRRIDETGALREPDPAADTTPAAAGAGSPLEAPTPVANAAQAAAEAQVAELTDTLQRVKAEYDNYRRRTERDRVAVTELATAAVLGQLLPVLDDIERARAHGDLTGAFGAVGDSLGAIVVKLGLESYGEAGEPFDPQVHDAVLQAPPTPDSDVQVAAEIFRPGYRYAGRVLRAAQVAVADPAGPSDGPAQAGDGPPAEDLPTG